MSEEQQRNFRAAKKEAQAQQQQAASPEKKQEQSKAEELNMQHVADILANKQLTDIHKAIEKLANQNETLQRKTVEGLQLNLQHYLDTRVVDATARILKEHTEKIENVQRNNAYYIQKINEKLEILLGGLAIIFFSAVGFAVYRYFIR